MKYDKSINQLELNETLLFQPEEVKSDDPGQLQHTEENLLYCGGGVVLDIRRVL